MTTVLIAEDDLVLLDDIALELELRGYNVLQAADGQKALDILRAEDTPLPDIIVSDIAMPDVDGFQLLERLRVDPKLEGIPLLFLTAFNSPNSIRISKELGADDYIVKPFRADDLVLAMENKLRRIHAFQKKANQQLDKARETLLRMISHELRTPLTAIYMGSRMLSDTLAEMPDHKIERTLDFIRSGADRLNRLTSKVSLLLEIDTGLMQQEFEQSPMPHDITKVVSVAVDLVRKQMSELEKSVSIEVASIDPQTTYVKGVFEYLTLMVQEPLRNAVAFSPRNGVVSLSIEPLGEVVQIKIQDQGSGIASDDLPHVWERFTQVNRAEHEHQGVGLGLAVVKECVEIHGGTAAIESTIGQGTTFTLLLPIASLND